METPEIGDMVRVKSVVMCERQGLDHGYNPLVEGRIGVIIPRLWHVAPPPSHPWRVQFLAVINMPSPISYWQYFAAAELELIEGAS